MRRLIALLCLSPPAFAQAAPAPITPTARLCEQAIDATDHRVQTAPGLLHAIGLVESGRRDPATNTRRPWPWTVTAEGVGAYFPAKADAIAAVQTLQARGVTSIDVGCMQVNLQFHPTAFRNLDDAFDPAPNVAYAARFLTALHHKLDDWPAAAAAYHSQTPAIGAEYAKLIAAVWSGAPVPVTTAPNGDEIVLFPGGAHMREFRDATTGHTRIVGILN